MTDMPPRSDRTAPAGYGLAHIFTLLALALALTLGGYWRGVAEPRLAGDYRSRATALAWSEAQILEKLLSREGDEGLRAALETALDAMLLIRDPTTASPFILRIALALDREALGPRAQTLEMERGIPACDACFVTSIPLYRERDGALIGVATFSSNPQFLNDLVGAVRAGLFWTGATVLVLIGLAWLGTRRLVRQLQEARAAAEGANRAKGVFLATMSHEIRTPLNALLGMTQLLERSELPAELQPQVAAIRHAGDALFALISNVLDYSQIEAGRLVPAEVEFDLTLLLQDTLSIFTLQAERKGLRLQSALDERLGGLTLGDPNRIRQILINLLGNALKFTETGSVGLEVGIEERRAGRDWVRFRVTDTGPGIPAEQLAALLQGGLAQGSGPRCHGQCGARLGLTICQRLAELLGGALGAESTPGAGSRFWVRLPLGRVAAEAAGAVAEGEAKPLSPPRRILVADDDGLSRMFLRLLLERAGHEVRLVENGLEVLAALANERFDLILLDLWMPKMDGCEAARRIRALPDPQQAALPILALTADVTEETEAECRRVGINQILRKPLAIEQIATALKTYGS